MPTQARREDELIKRFVWGYQNCSWRNANIDWPDKVADKGVDALVTRTSDGKTLAIEHTIIEPFVGEKGDFVNFERAFVGIERDAQLPVPDRWIRLFVQVGALRDRRESERQAVVKAVHDWIAENRNVLPMGDATHHCSVAGVRGEPNIEIVIATTVVYLQGPGRLHVRRLQMEDDFNKVVDKALRKKVPKLANTNADKRILLLERQHMNLVPSKMLGEIEAQRTNYKAVGNIDEIWIVETMFWGSEGYVFFECYREGDPHDQFGFHDKEFFE